MKTTLTLFLISFFSLQLAANIPASAEENRCPKNLMVSIQCSENNSEFQLLKHVGKYSEPKMEWDKIQNHMICSYGASEWVSKYKINDASGVKIATVSTLQELAPIASFIRSKGFQFGSDVRPFSMVTYKPTENDFTADQMFLYSGLESTFGKNSVTVTAANNTNITTAVLNERFMKSEDAATDSYVTGSNCFIQIKN